MRPEVKQTGGPSVYKGVFSSRGNIGSECVCVCSDSFAGGGNAARDNQTMAADRQVRQ